MQELVGKFLITNRIEAVEEVAEKVTPIGTKVYNVTFAVESEDGTAPKTYTQKVSETYLREMASDEPVKPEDSYLQKKNAVLKGMAELLMEYNCNFTEATGIARSIEGTVKDVYNAAAHLLMGGAPDDFVPGYEFGNFHSMLDAHFVNQLDNATEKPEAN